VYGFDTVYYGYDFICLYPFKLIDSNVKSIKIIDNGLHIIKDDDIKEYLFIDNNNYSCNSHIVKEIYSNNDVVLFGDDGKKYYKTKGDDHKKYFPVKGKYNNMLKSLYYTGLFTYILVKSLKEYNK